ncbi:MAG TPA: ATP-binding protein [Candidatus Saccharimonadales bacterium]|nr:ATP-binding protein [Candidatus Saccharimonadales bacterium]
MFFRVLVKFTIIPIIPLLILTVISFDPSLWIASEIHHFYIELFAVILVSALAFYYILRARVLKDNFSLFIGIGFLISGLIDMLHVMVSITLIENMDFLKYFIPQTWFAGRFFLSAMLLIAIVKYSSSTTDETQDNDSLYLEKRYDDDLNVRTLGTIKKTKGKIIDNSIISIVVLGVLASSIALSSLFLVFPASVLDDYTVHRPYEIPPLILFVLALFYFYKKRLYLRKDVLYKGIITYLVIDIFAQIIMSFSASSFDTSHNLAHVIKDAGYFVNIIALVLSSIQYTKNLKKSNALIRNQYAKVKEAEKMKDEFINISAHELRTPIQPIIGLSGMLNEDFRNKKVIEMKDVEKGLSVIYRNAKRLQKLTDDILDVTKIESNELKLEIGEFDLLKIISNTINDCTIEIEKKQENILFVCKNEFNNEINNYDKLKMRSKEQLIVKGDKNRITQVLSNLINNAIKFTRKGSICVSVERQINGEVIVSVIDTGIGIDLEIIPYLFKKFVSNSFSGTGLGLYISKSIIEAHGGKIWAENNKNGNGATFSFSLPFKK